MASVALVLVGCGSGGSSLSVDLQTDYRAEEVSRFEVALVDGASARTMESVPSGDLSAGVRVARWDVAAGTHQVRGRVYDVEGRLLQTRNLVVNVNGRTGVTMSITRACEAVDCGGSESECLGGQCVAEECTFENRVACVPEFACATDDECPTASACGRAMCRSGFCFEFLDDDQCDGAVCTINGCVLVSDAGGFDAGFDSRVPQPDASGTDATTADAGQDAGSDSATDIPDASATDAADASASDAGSSGAAVFVAPELAAYVVPAGITRLRVKLWGAGGGGKCGYGTVPGERRGGGGGGFVSGELAVSPGETLTISVGEGGGSPLAGPVFGGGGLGGRAISFSPWDGFSGGGGTRILRGPTALMIAGGGGGGGDGCNDGTGFGGPGGSGGDGGAGNNGATPGTGAVGDTPGVGGVWSRDQERSGEDGTLDAGGAGGTGLGAGGGGGGGGYYGGGGGRAEAWNASTAIFGGGAGGGSSYAAPIVMNANLETGTEWRPGGVSDVDYVAPWAEGGGESLEAGQNGRIVIIPLP